MQARTHTNADTHYLYVCVGTHLPDLPRVIRVPVHIVGGQDEGALGQRLHQILHVHMCVYVCFCLCVFLCVRACVCLCAQCVCVC